MRWSERPPAARSRFEWLLSLHFERRTPSVAVAHLILVRRNSPLMYGVPADLPLQRFVGDALFQVCVGMDGIHFRFGRAGTICVYGHWELHDSLGSLLDSAQEHSERKHYRVHDIFNKDVAAYSIDPPRSFCLTFASGHRLTIYDDTPQYEAFLIMPDEIRV